MSTPTLHNVVRPICAVIACVLLAFSDWLAGQLWRRVRGRPADPLGDTARGFGAFLLS